ncbi:MAG: hypothetical protein ACRD68_07800 [Pyrinomonadaceae bacterium]
MQPALSVSATGSQQFLAGLPVTDVRDRRAFAVWLTVGVTAFANTTFDDEAAPPIQ